MPFDRKGYLLDTDTNNYSMGCVLQQSQEGELKVIGCVCKAFSETELHYCMTHRELASEIFGRKYYRHFLLGFPLVLRTDHAALTNLMRILNPVAQSARYLNTLAEYQFTVQYWPGLAHCNVDALSRRPCGREHNASLCQQCGPLLDPVAEDPDADEAAMKMDDHGCGSETAGLHFGLYSVEDGPQIPGSSGASVAEMKAKAEFDHMEAELYMFRTRRTVPADLTAEHEQPRVNFHLPLASPDSEGAESAGITGEASNIMDANELIEHQKRDVELGVIRAWLKHHDAVPDKNELHSAYI